MVMNQYMMVVIGGSCSDRLIDPTPVPFDDALWTYELESGHWAKLVPRDSNENDGTDVAPWNLVHHRAFKLDYDHFGVIWYDSDAASK